jgi:hypothetical protein
MSSSSAKAASLANKKISEEFLENSMIKFLMSLI